MTRPLTRRGVALLVAPVLALGAVPVLSGPAAAAPATDPRPAQVGAAWLAGQLTGGLLHNAEFGFDDYGLSIDAALALDAVGGRDQAVEDVTDALADNVDSYTTGVDFGAPGDVFAGATAKALALATSQGRNGSSYGGVDLESRLESTVLTDPALEGRIKDVSGFGDFANVIGQGFAARGLHASGSGLADEVTGFLLDQQCSAGFFRLSFAAESAVDQTCDGDPASAGSSDATALAVLALLDQRGAPAVDTAIADAAAWLRSQQRKNGSLGGGPSTEAANANSTGLAGWVFAEVGRNRAASLAAGWVRAHQADETSPCTTRLAGRTGAVGYDAASVALGRKEGITSSTADQWRRATSQALPVLDRAPAGGTPVLQTPRGYVKAGTVQRFVLDAAAPGASVCFRRGSRTSADAAGRGGKAVVRLAMPRRTSTAGVVAKTSAGQRVHGAVDVLGPLSIDPRPAKRSVRRGGRQTVRVSNLAPAERVAIRFRGTIVKRATAGARGNAKATFRVGRKAGRTTVTVVGEFAQIRRGSATFRVRR